jgi:hypothetical protein
LPQPGGLRCVTGRGCVIWPASWDVRSTRRVDRREAVLLGILKGLRPLLSRRSMFVRARPSVSVTAPGLPWPGVVLVVNVVSRGGHAAARVVAGGRVRVLIRVAAPRYRLAARRTTLSARTPLWMSADLRGTGTLRAVGPE